MSRVYGIILATVLLWPTGAASDQPLWTICGLTLKLGMREDAVRSRVSSECKATELGSKALLLIGKASTGENQVLGSVSFSGRQLVAASRDWLTAAAHSDQDFAEAFYGALSSAGLLGATVHLEAEELHSPEVSSRSITIASAQRKVTISFGKNLVTTIAESAELRPAHSASHE
jgi:hypothetical protein